MSKEVPSADEGVGAKTRFMFELSEEVKALKTEAAASKKRQADLEAWIQGDLSASLSTLQAKVKGIEGTLEGVRTDLANTRDAVSALGRWRDEKLGRDLDNLGPQVASLFHALETRYAAESKQREQGLWDVFARKSESERQIVAKEREVAAAQFSKEFAEHQASVKQVLETELAELRAATKSLKEGAKTLSKVEASSKRNEAQLEKIELEVQRLEETKAQAQQLIKRLADEASARIAPEKESQQFSRMVQVLEDDRKKTMEVEAKFEAQRKAMLQTLNAEFTSAKLEIAKAVREELSRRIGEEFRWHGLAPSEEERARSAAASAQGGAAPARRDEPNQVEKWLKRTGLPQYADAFAQGGFEFLYVVALLDEKDLDAMNVTTIGHRRILLAAAKQLALDIESAMAASSD